MLARNKLNSIENKMSKTLMDNEVRNQKKIGINEVIKRNEIISNSLKQ